MKVKVKAVSRKNKGYVGILTNTNDYGERWMSAKDEESTKNIKKGDLLNIDVVENGEYLNFTIGEQKDIEEGIFKRHEERLDGQSLGNARNNATDIAIAMYQQGDIKKEQIKTALKELTSYILTLGE